jgi:single-strand DNA-binding protein
MNETVVTVVGNVATAPVFRELPTGSVARFRLAATARHRDRETGTWSDGHTNFFTVWAWRGLGTNVAASLSVGEPVIVQGRLRVRNEERGVGQQWMSADIDAVAVGHDLSRGTTAFRRVTRADGPATGRPPAPSGESGPGPAWERETPAGHEAPPSPTWDAAASDHQASSSPGDAPPRPGATADSPGPAAAQATAAAPF